MRLKANKNRDGVFKSILLAHVILFLHLVLFAALGLLVAFLNGVMQNMLWIFLGAMATVALSGYLFYRRLKREGKSLGELLRSPVFEGRSVEVSLLGGVATLKLDQTSAPKAIEAGPMGNPVEPRQLEDPQIARIREINTLAQLLEKELITLDEFIAAKERLLPTKPSVHRF